MHRRGRGERATTSSASAAVRELRGEAPREDVEPEVTLAVAAHIPDDDVHEVPQRLFFYKTLAQAQTDDELSDVKAELADRYGEPPEEVESLAKLMAAKAEMRLLRLRALESYPG